MSTRKTIFPNSRPIALAIRVLVGLIREYSWAGISYASVAVSGVALRFCHTSKEILTFLKFTFQNLNKTWGKSTFLNNSMHVTEQNLHKTYGKSTFLNNAIDVAELGRTPPRSSPRHPSKNVTISFIKLSQIHHFLSRSGSVPFWPASQSASSLSKPSLALPSLA